MTYAYQINQSMICGQLVEYANIGRIWCAIYCQDRWLFLSRYCVVAMERRVRFLFTLSHHVLLMMRLPCTQNALFGSGLSRSYWSLIAEVLKLSVLMVSVECFRHNVFYWPFLKGRSSFWIRKPELLASAIGDEVGPWIFQSRGTIWLLQNNGSIL